MESIITKTNALQCSDLADLEEDELNASIDYSLTLLAKVISPKSVNPKAVQTILQKAWNPAKGMSCQHQRDNIFSIFFKHEWDRKRVLDSCPWLVMSSYLVVRDWPPHLTLEEIEFSYSPFWIRISGLPPNLMSRANAEKIGSKLGVVLDIDFATEGNLSWFKYLRIQVKMDISKPLQTGFKRIVKHSIPSWVRIQYERMPDFYFTCGRLGHTNKFCQYPTPIPPENMVSPFGHWLRLDYHDHCPPSAKWNPSSIVSDLSSPEIPQSPIVDSGQPNPKAQEKDNNKKKPSPTTSRATSDNKTIMPKPPTAVSPIQSTRLTTPFFPNFKVIPIPD
ncbi:hypothetical protein RJ640_001386 [Escallonia rubra]|uniref:DUF4283 domain-containing protein n=1 Tax=Escallonia rubra TaxID=112253 RepID=A0AA88RL95_9ASTE|nr:hypothetical protein RJ640_001386 [Escallonia rubra]